MAHEIAHGCRFSTRRLDVGDWHDLSNRYRLDLVEIVGRVLTTATTTALSPDWHGDYDSERATRWIEARDAESPTLLVVERQSGRGIGLLILFEDEGHCDSHGVDLRLGYVLAESAWGRGIASELVGGLVGWARSEPRIGSMHGGVAHGNEASAAVLRKNGFEPSHARSGEQIYELTVHPSGAR